MPSYTLVYFDVRGRAELSRLAFAAAGIKYTDERFGFDSWPEKKAKTLYGQVPELLVDGKPLGQSNAIARFLAREFGLAGKTNMDAAQVDQYVELANDLMEQIFKTYFEKDESKKAELNKNLSEEVFPKFMGYFENGLKENGGSFLVGGGLTLADLAVFNVFDLLLEKDSGAMDKFPVLKKNRDKVGSESNIKQYLANRKKSDV